MDKNSRLLQARAFVALTTLILERNGRSLPGWPSHREALERLKDGLTRPPGGILLASELASTEPLEFTADLFDGDVDPVKWVASSMNITRTMDLYLAIENAYQDDDPDEWRRPDGGRLLSRAQKATLIDRINASIEASVDVLNLGALGKSIDEIITGNWPLKVWLSIGYACLHTQQGDGLRAYPVDRWLQRAITRCGGQGERARKKYWSYQTSAHHDVARRYWAEGPYYFHYVLADAVAFWHAVRAHGLLGYRRSTPLSDPFHADWFITPLAWLADIATPDGRTPPVDDGNKYPISNAGLLAWSGVYGAEAVGRGFASIAVLVTGYPRSGSFAAYANTMNPDVMVLQLAVPPSPPPARDVRPALIGNTTPARRDEQQLIFRKPIAGHTHYVYLHGETLNDAISRGEGHEQPDQLQLLYYVDDQSYLLDPGYDRGSPFKNSTWNAYNLHSVMAFDQEDGDNHGGLSSPRFDPVKIRKEARHRPVRHLYYQQHGRLTIFRGAVRLAMGRGHKKNESLYERVVLIVEDDEAPYLIDLNSVTALKNRRLRKQDYVMRYNANSNRFVPPSAPHDWHTWQIAPQNLYCFFEPVEFAASSYRRQDVEVRETFGDSVRIAALMLESQNQPSFTTVGFFYVGPGQPGRAPAPLIDYPASRRDRPAQAWAWLHEETGALDVLIKRSTLHRDAYQRPLTVRVADAGNKALTLSGGVDFGFARLARDGGAWRIHPDYRWVLGR